jgi:hypothetical protein
MFILQAIVLTFVLLGSAGAQTMYRCGNTFSHSLVGLTPNRSSLC